VLQVHLALLDHVLLELLAMLAGTPQPGRYGALIDAEGRDDGLERTAVAQQGKDDGHQLCGGPQPIEWCTFGGRKGLATARTAVALRRLALHSNVPLPHLSSSMALGVVAKLRLRVHRWPPLDVSLLSQVRHVEQDARRTRFFSTTPVRHHG
jgi:hypothetical protein